MITLLNETNVILAFASGFFICILSGVFKLSKTLERMGDDKK